MATAFSLWARIFVDGREGEDNKRQDCGLRMRMVDCVKKEAKAIMPQHIILTAEQARVALQTGEPVEVRDEQGRTVAHLTPLHPADIEAIEQSKRSRGAGGPLVPSDQLQAHLRRLGEIRTHQGMDEAKMLDSVAANAGRRTRMNPFRVEWEPAAEDELARIWLRSSDPDSVTAAQAHADQMLSRDPIKYGRHLSEGLYSMDAPPLILTYTIDTAARRVEVAWVQSSS